MPEAAAEVCMMDEDLSYLSFAGMYYGYPARTAAAEIMMHTVLTPAVVAAATVTGVSSGMAAAAAVPVLRIQKAAVVAAAVTILRVH